MMEIIFKIWYFIVILPYILLREGTAMFADFLKKSGAYAYWDIWHSALVIAIILAIIAWARGY